MNQSTLTTRRYQTTVLTEWDIKGDISPEDINERIRLAINIIMATKPKEDGSYGMFLGRHELTCRTEEIK